MFLLSDHNLSIPFLLFILASFHGGQLTFSTYASLCLTMLSAADNIFRCYSSLIFRVQLASFSYSLPPLHMYYTHSFLAYFFLMCRVDLYKEFAYCSLTYFTMLTVIFSTANLLNIFQNDLLQAGRKII